MVYKLKKIVLLAAPCCITFAVGLYILFGNRTPSTTASSLSTSDEDLQLDSLFDPQARAQAQSSGVGAAMKEARTEESVTESYSVSESSTSSDIAEQVLEYGVKSENPAADKPGNSEPPTRLSVILLVKTAPEYFKRRQMTRELWFNRCKSGNYAGDSPHHVAKNYALKARFDVYCLFLTGRSSKSAINALVEREKVEKEDLYIAPILDGYDVMTAKSQWSLLWIVLQQRHRDYIMLVDDDTYVVLASLLPWLERQARTKFYAGHCHLNRRIVQCKKDPHNPNCIDFDTYGSNSYPPFATGFAYVLSPDAAASSALQIVAGLTHALPGSVEDAVLGVMMARSGIGLLDDEGFVHWTDEDKTCPPDVDVIAIGAAPDETLPQFAENEAAGRPVCAVRPAVVRSAVVRPAWQRRYQFSGNMVRRKRPKKEYKTVDTY